MPSSRLTFGRWIVAPVWAAVTPAVLAQGVTGTPPEPLDPVIAGRLSLEELMNINVTSVAGVEQQLVRTPAAVHVITGDDIRRTGHRSIAEALRLSPGLFVGRVGSSNWAISPRGFNALFANKTLVLMDGRRVYDPLQGGTFWDVQDTLLEDIDRIEVVRGPGATLWGANAVNGVINIVTKSSRDTQGLYLQGGAGTHEHGFGGFRYGGKLADNAHFSVWGKYFKRGPLEAAGPDDANDEWDLAHARFRTDIRTTNEVDLTFQVDGYSTITLAERRNVPVPGQHLVTESVLFQNRARGGHALFRAERFSAPEEGWSLLAYYDRTDRLVRHFNVDRDSFEIDARYHFTLGERHALATGVEYFHTIDRTQPSAVISIDPESTSRGTPSAFIQDTITLKPDRWFAMLGSKFEHNSISGFEVQPSGRLWFTPNERQTAWAAVSRSVRTPSRAEEGLIPILAYADRGLLGGGPATGTIEPIFGLLGNSEIDSERIMSYELGYRHRFTERFSVDVAGFYNHYDSLVSLPVDLVDSEFNNDGEADTFGGELAVDWRVSENWRLRGSYSYVEVDISGPVLDFDEGFTPHNMAQVRSYLDLSDKFELNAAAYYVDEVPGQSISDYLRLDVGVTWRPRPNFELAVWGQNLLEPRHREFSALDVERGVYISATLRY